jgi:hypothetical protein
MDKLIDAATEGALWGLAFGAALVVLRPVRRAARPALRTAMKGGVAATHFVSDATRKSRTAIGELYAEAEKERADQRVGNSARAQDLV